MAWPMNLTTVLRGELLSAQSLAQRLADEAVGKGDEFIASLRNSAAARLPE